MGIQQDLKAVFEEVGMGYTILRSGGNITGEFLDYTPNTQVTKPFTIEHQLQVEFAFDTKAVVGDILQFTNDGRKYIVMHINEETFENSTITKSGVLYRLNVVVNITRLPAAIDYKTAATWTDVLLNVDALLESKEYGARIDTTPKPIEGIPRFTFVAYMPNSVPVVKDDRITVQGYVPRFPNTAVQHLRVDQVDDFTFRGTTVLYLREDARK